MLTLYITSFSTDLPRGEKKRTETRAGRALLAYALQRRGALPASFWAKGADVNQMLCYGPHGKPFFRELGLQFNISHSHGLAVCGLSSLPLGVDVERARRFSPALRERTAAPEEAGLWQTDSPDGTLTQLWTCKESYIKYTGLGLSQGVEGIRFAALGQRPQLAQKGGVRFFSLPLLRGGERFWLTVCHEGGPVGVEFVPRRSAEAWGEAQ